MSNNKLLSKEHHFSFKENVHIWIMLNSALIRVALVQPVLALTYIPVAPLGECMPSVPRPGFEPHCVINWCGGGHLQF